MSIRKNILAVDDEPSMLRLLEISLKQADYQPILARDGAEALQKIKDHQIDCVVSDLHMPIMNGLDLLKNMRELTDNLPFIMVTAQGEIKTAVEAMKLGASDYILRPFDLETLEIAIAKTLQSTQTALENTYLKSTIYKNSLIGESQVMQQLKTSIQLVAPEKTTVLITGETGTGKELIAKALHAQSARAGNLFVAVNCAAIPAEMLESELFGHEKGAFTGAVKERVGKFELAQGGTLFLDEVTEMPIALQAKLLRALQEGVIEKVGSNKSIQLDIRVVAATNQNPLEAVKQQKLREDLYYRLNVFSINAPPLRERIGDIAALAQYFATQQQTQLSDEAIHLLQSYNWPGNVRELENMIERASILAHKKTILLSHLPSDIKSDALEANIHAPSGASLSLPAKTAQIEKQFILQALDTTHGNKAKAAKLLEISERSLWNKLETYQLK